MASIGLNLLIIFIYNDVGLLGKVKLTHNIHVFFILSECYFSHGIMLHELCRRNTTWGCQWETTTGGEDMALGVGSLETGKAVVAERWNALYHMQ